VEVQQMKKLHEQYTKTLKKLQAQHAKALEGKTCQEMEELHAQFIKTLVELHARHMGALGTEPCSSKDYFNDGDSSGLDPPDKIPSNSIEF